MPKSDGIKNLRTPSTDEARKIGKKGGEASALSRNATKYLKDLAIKVLLENKLNPQGERYYERQGMSNGKGSKDMLEAIMKGLAVKAAKGDTAAAKTLFELMGYKPSEEELDASITVKFTDKIDKYGD